MDQIARQHVEKRLADARKDYALDVAEMRGHLQQLDDPEHSSSTWRNLAVTAALGSLHAGQIDAYTTALAADDASTANPKPGKA